MYLVMCAHCSKWILPFNRYSNTVRWVLLLSPFCRWEKWSPKLKVSWLVSGRTRTDTQTFLVLWKSKQILGRWWQICFCTRGDSGVCGSSSQRRPLTTWLWSLGERPHSGKGDRMRRAPVGCGRIQRLSRIKGWWKGGTWKGEREGARVAVTGTWKVQEVLARSQIQWSKKETETGKQRLQVLTILSEIEIK